MNNRRFRVAQKLRND